VSVTIIDVSRWQHAAPIDYKAVFDAGVRGVIIEARDADGAVNPYFAEDWRGFKAVGMGVGGYIYCRPANVASAAEQAADLEKLLSFGGPAWADWEQDGLDVEFERMILEKAPGVSTYVPGYVLEAGTGEMWGPHPWTTYGSPLQAKCELVQVSIDGRVPGISGAVDVNTWERDDEAFKETFKIVGPPASPPPVSLGEKIVAIVGCSSGGFWLCSEAGHVYALDGAPYLGDCSWQLAEPVVAMAAAGPRGYWLVTSGGAVHPFGAAGLAKGVVKLGAPGGVVSSPS